MWSIVLAPYYDVAMHPVDVTVSKRTNQTLRVMDPVSPKHVTVKPRFYYFFLLYSKK